MIFHCNTCNKRDKVKFTNKALTIYVSCQCGNRQVYLSIKEELKPTLQKYSVYSTHQLVINF
jgi:hypothetical protein